MTGSRRTRLMGLAIALGVTAAAGLTAGVSRAAAADPSGLQLLRTVEAGHQTTPNTGANGAPFQDDTTIEPSIAVNPANPMEIVTGTQTGRDDAGGGIDNGFATSHDGGLTWTSGAMPGVTAASGNTQYPRASDAVVAWGRARRSTTPASSSIPAAPTRCRGCSTRPVTTAASPGTCRRRFSLTRAAVSTTRTGRRSTSVRAPATTSAGSMSSGTGSPASSPNIPTTAG